MENKSYGFYIVYQIGREVFNFTLFGNEYYNEFGNASLNYNKPLEELTNEDYENIREMLSEEITKQKNKLYKEHHDRVKEKDEYKYKEDLIKKENITIVNMIPKKSEVINNA